MITLKKGGIGGTGGPMDRPAMTYTPQTLLWHLQIKLGDAHVPWKQACEWLRRADHALAEIVKKDGVVDRVVYNEFVREAVEYIRSPGRRPPTMRFEANPHRSGDTGWGETPVARRGAHRKSRASRVLRPGASAPSHEHGWQYPGHSERVEAHAARIEALGLAEDEPEKRKKKKKATRVKDFSNESSARSTQRPWHDQSRRRSRTAPTFSVRETLEGFHVAASRAGVPWHLVCKWLENAEDYLSRHANMLGRVEAPVALSVSLDLDRVVKKHGQKGVGRNRNPSPGHTHPMLKHPIPRGRVIGELYDLYYKAKLPGDPELSWPNSLSSKHAEDPRRYAQVFFGGGDPGIGGRGRPRVELAEQVRWLPAAQRRGLLAHEVGHIVYPEGTEDEADQAAYESTGVKIGYDHRWPGKGLQTARNPRSYWVFNYGSNDPDQIEDRVGRRLKGVGAVALGYERVFRGWSSTRQCGVASLKKKRGAVTYGWAGKLTEPELRELDRYEGVRSGNYRRKVIDIEIAETGERVEAITYIATSREYGKPSRAYLEACAKTVGTFWNEGNVSPDDFPLRNPGDRELREQQRLSAAGDPEATYRAMHDHKRRGTLRLTVNNLVTFLEAYPRSTAPQIAEFFRKPAGNAGRIIGIAARAGRIHSNEQELFQQIMQGVYQQHRIERPLVDVGIHGIESEAGLPVGTISSVRNRARSGAAWSAGSDYSSYNHDIVGLLDDAGIQMPREPSQHSGASSPSRKAKIVQLKQVEDMVRHAATIPHGPIVGYVVTTAGNRLRDLLAHLRKGARYDRGVKSEVHGITTLLRGPFRSAMNDVLRELRGPLR
jgi:cation transport regulator ChaC